MDCPGVGSLCIVPRRAKSHWTSELIGDGRPATLSPRVQILIATNGELSVTLIVLSKEPRLL